MVQLRDVKPVEIKSVLDIGMFLSPASTIDFPQFQGNMTAFLAGGDNHLAKQWACSVHHLSEEAVKGVLTHAKSLNERQYSQSYCRIADIQLLLG